MSWDDNVYYHPEKWGLTAVYDVEWRDEAYEFEITAVWKDKDGVFYVASDSGCSCPVPFEDYDSIESLDKYDSRQALLNAVFNDRVAPLLNSDYEYERRYAERAQSEFADLSAVVMRA
jgi:hypothetical protein